MSEDTTQDTGRTTQDRKPHTSRAARWSVYPAIGAWLMLFVAPLLGIMCDWLGKDFVESEFGDVLCVAWLIMWGVLICIATLLSLTGIIQIITSHFAVRGLPRALVSLGAVLLLIFLLLPAVKMTRGLYKSQIDRANLTQLHAALRLYAADFDGRYPTPEKWCDLLIKHTGISPKTFKSPSDKTGPCSYGLNPNADANSPDNMIVLIETSPGWNQFGARELAGTAESAWIIENGGRTEYYSLEGKSSIWQTDPNE